MLGFSFCIEPVLSPKCHHHLYYHNPSLFIQWSPKVYREPTTCQVLCHLLEVGWCAQACTILSRWILLSGAEGGHWSRIMWTGVWLKIETNERTERNMVIRVHSRGSISGQGNPGGTSEGVIFGLRSEESVGWWRGKHVPGRGCAKALWQAGVEECQGDWCTEKESVKRAERAS